MTKKYLDINVLEAFKKRMDYIFCEFDNIYVSFSGGKDSGLLLNLVLDYMLENKIKKKLGVFHLDFEAQYNVTTGYVESVFEKNAGRIEPYWICLPMAARTSLSNYQIYWYPWDDTKEEMWVRPMPQKPYVINLKNNPFYYYSYKMHQENLSKQFGRWYKEIHGGGKTICLLGVRASESLQRYNSFVNKKYGYKGKCWISKMFKDVWCGSPMYDWKVEDVWAANYKFGYAYNGLYDMYFRAGLKPNQMRVASPFNDYARDSLHLYRVLEPETWVRLLGRVQGANFASIYGRTAAMAYRSIKLPEGHTWRSYTDFLLSTLPARLRKKYIEKFRTSIKFWHDTGGGLSEETISELIEKGYQIKTNGVSNYTVDKKTRIVFVGKIPDDTDDILSTKDIPSWKRMCICILKNDHNCKSMGFAESKKQRERIDRIKKKYKSLEAL
jgi:predicted phosphoadenosine phosphosulfate sulfurtransferase